MKKTLDNTHTNYALNLYVSHASMCLDIYLQRSCYVVPTHYRGGHSYLKGEYSAVYLIVIFSNILNIYVFNWSTHIKVEHLRVKVSFYLLPVQYPVVIAFYVILQAELKKNHCSNGHGTIYLSYFYWWIIKLNSLFYRVHIARLGRQILIECTVYSKAFILHIKLNVPDLCQCGLWTFSFCYRCCVYKLTFFQPHLIKLHLIKSKFTWLNKCNKA